MNLIFRICGEEIRRIDETFSEQLPVTSFALYNVTNRNGTDNREAEDRSLKMTFFLAVFLAVYSLMHAVFFLSVKELLPASRFTRAGFILFLGLMVIMPVATRLLERNGHETAARILAHAGFPWMAFVFLAFCGFLALTIIQLVPTLINITCKVNIDPPAGTLPVLCVLAGVFLACFYGYIDAKRIRTERVVIETDKLPLHMKRLRIAQISDIHLGLLVRGDRLESILEKVKVEDPDILVSTGDLVDGEMGSPDGLRDLFDEIQPRYGKFAVTGNHEFYYGVKDAVRVTEHLGFTVLRGTCVNVYDIINVAGVDDPASGTQPDETAVLSRARNGLFTLLLKHRPASPPESRGLFDLQLSGHTHRGQIFPFRWITGLAYPMQNGMHRLDGGSMLYASRGSGTWGPPIRVLSPPEITIIDLVRRGSGKGSSDMF